LIQELNQTPMKLGQTSMTERTVPGAVATGSINAITLIQELNQTPMKLGQTSMTERTVPGAVATGSISRGAI
jgi:hypothetical protein